MTFVNPKDPSGNPIFAIICPSHQVIFLMMFLKKIIACILINFILIAIFCFKLTLEVEVGGDLNIMLQISKNMLCHLLCKTAVSLVKSP